MDKWEYRILHVDTIDVKVRERTERTTVVLRIDSVWQMEHKEEWDNRGVHYQGWEGTIISPLDYFRKLGKEGWELVAVKGESYDSMRGIYYFKRKLE
jgi:hypothetical protein